MKPSAIGSGRREIPSDGRVNVRATPVAVPATGKLKVLCVDDDEIVLLSAQAILGNRFDVQSARTGTEGLASLVDFKPDWVVVDYGMPGMDGPRFMLMARQWGIRASFVLLTGLDAGEMDWETLRPLGLKGYMRKPIDIDLFLDIVEGRA